jgi:hypothetical protein
LQEQDFLKKIIILSVLSLLIVDVTLSDETPLAIDIGINDTIWLKGQIVIFNGWPHIRMMVCENKLIGIDENNFPQELYNDILYAAGKGLFKLKYTGNTGLPYYEIPLPVFEITEYKDIEILN